jgi:hypothetical protein
VADKQLDVLVICGSLRKGSYNAALARALPALAPAGMKLRPAPAFDKFPIYNHDIQDTTGFPAEVQAWADAIRSADGVIVVSSAAVAHLGRHPAVRAPRGPHHVCRAEIRREDARAQGSDRDRPDQAAARGL